MKYAKKLMNGHFSDSLISEIFNTVSEHKQVILYQNNNARMTEAGELFEEVIDAGISSLETNFGDIFKLSKNYTLWININSILSLV